MKLNYRIIRTSEHLSNKQETRKLKDLVDRATVFIEQIKEGNLEASFKGLEAEESLEDGQILENRKGQEGGKNLEAGLGQEENGMVKALIGMQQKLQELSAEESQRRWTVEGIAHFADILRNNDQQAGELYNTIIAELAKYVKANQASLFVVNDENPKDIHLTLEACYAYDKKKYLTKRIEPGQGMVGQAYLEKEENYLTKVPANYLEITSGLGLATPRCLYIFPLKVNDQVMGIIELASFKPFEKYQREFMAKLGESMAVTISNAKINHRNKSLLELSQNQTAQLREQEEEMRQNMEELQATQEEIQRKMRESLRIQQELDARMAVLNKTALLTESDLHGTITFVNEKFCQVAKWPKEEAIGKPHNIVRHPDNPKELYKDMWQCIKGGNIFQGKFANLAKDGSTYWVDATIAPVLDEEGNIIKYIGIRFDITDQVEKEKDLQALIAEMQEHKSQMQQNEEELQAQEEELRQNMEELSSSQEEISRQLRESERLKREMEAREQVLTLSTILSESDLFGTILFANDKLCEVSKYSREELIGQPHSIFRHPDMPRKIFKLMWNTIQKGEVFRGIVKNRAKDGSHYWVDALISPVLDEDGKPAKYIGARYVIEDDELAEMMFGKMLKKLSLSPAMLAD